MAATQVTVTATFNRAPGVPQSRASLSWQLSGTMFDSSGSVVCDTEPIPFPLCCSGVGSAVVWAVDDTTSLPVGLVWTLSGTVGGRPFSQSYAIGKASGPTVDLSTLIPSLVSVPSFGYALISTSIQWAAPPTGIAATDTASIQAALAALGGPGGTIELQAGQYVCSTLNFDGTSTVTLRGRGGRTPGGSGPGATSISFPTVGSGTLLSARSTNGFCMRGVYVRYTDATFTGTLIDLTHSALATDSNYPLFDDCSIRGVVASGQTAVLVDLDKCILPRFNDTIIQGGGIGIRGKASQGSYSNVAHFTGSVAFRDQDVIAVRNPGEAWSFDGVTWEPLRGGRAGAIDHDSGVTAKALSLKSCWMGDVTDTSTRSWVTFSGTALSITSSEIGGNQTGTAALTLDENNAAGVNVTGNNFQSLLTAVATGSTTGGKNFNLFPNAYTNVTNQFTGSIPSDSVGILTPPGTEWGFPYTYHPTLTLSAISLYAANRAVYFRVHDRGTISKIAIETTVTSGNICVGVYRPTALGRSAVPVTQIATSGSVACPTGYAEISLGTTVEVLPGDYFALVSDNATAVFRTSSAQSPSQFNTALGVSYYNDGTFPLPSPAVFGSGGPARLAVALMIGVA